MGMGLIGGSASFQAKLNFARTRPLRRSWEFDTFLLRFIMGTKLHALTINYEIQSIKSKNLLMYYPTLAS